MHSIDLIRENLTRSEEIVLSRIDDMREHCVVFPSPGGGCHTLWVLGHLAYIEGLVIHSFMLGEPIPLADWKELFDTDDISGDEGRYPPFDRVLAECRHVRASTISLLDSFGEDDLDTVSKNRPNAKGVEGLFGTYRRCFQYAADHWFMHRGQLADARCAAGVERMWYQVLFRRRPRNESSRGRGERKPSDNPDARAGASLIAVPAVLLRPWMVNFP